MMKKKLLLAISIPLTIMLIIGVFVVDYLVKNDTSWAHQVNFQEGSYVSETIKTQPGEQPLYDSFKIDFYSVTYDTFISNSNCVRYERVKNKTTTYEYYQIYFSYREIGDSDFVNRELKSIEFSHRIGSNSKPNTVFFTGQDEKNNHITINIHKNGIHSLLYKYYYSADLKLL